MSKSNKMLALSFALAGCITAPSAFAQDPVKTTASQDAMAQDQKMSPPMEAKADEPSESAKPSWGHLDVNNDGNLSTSEAASMPSIAKVFGKADADGNGELTQDEYSAWVAANGGANENKQPE